MMEKAVKNEKETDDLCVFWPFPSLQAAIAVLFPYCAYMIAEGLALSGIVAGTLFSVTLTFSDVTRIGGVHVGLVGCGVNVVVACLLSLLVRERANPASSGQPKR